MAYNFNPNFAKHFNSNNSSYKNITRTGDETPYSNPGMFSMSNSNHNTKLINFVNKDNFEEITRMYKLEEIDHPNGWDFKELDILGEMGFNIEDEYKMYSEVEIPSLQMQNEKVKVHIYKTDEGYTIETNRRYIFESFDKLIEFIDSVPMKNL